MSTSTRMPTKDSFSGVSANIEVAHSHGQKHCRPVQASPAVLALLTAFERLYLELPVLQKLCMPLLSLEAYLVLLFWRARSTLSSLVPRTTFHVELRRWCKSSNSRSEGDFLHGRRHGDLPRSKNRSLCIRERRLTISMKVMTIQKREVTSDLLGLAYILVNAEVYPVFSFLNSP